MQVVLPPGILGKGAAGEAALIGGDGIKVVTTLVPFAAEFLVDGLVRIDETVGAENLAHVFRLDGIVVLVVAVQVIAAGTREIHSQ